jgi:hypothetical protein
MENYKYESFSLVANYVKNRLFDLNAVPYSETLREFDDKFNKVKDEENAAYNIIKTSEIRPYSEIHILDYLAYGMNDFSIDNISLDKYYDNSGKLHRFDIFIYQNINNKGVLSGPKLEYNRSELSRMFKNFDISEGNKNLNNKKDIDFYNKYKKMVIVNKKCSTCNKIDNFSKKNNSSIEKKIFDRNKLVIFYEYYESICPKGELHEFKSNNKCIKCNINDDIKNNLSTEYYKKYLSNYNKIKEKKQVLLNDIIKGYTVKSVKKKDIQNSVKKWSFTTDLIKKISSLFNINYNTWSNLGASYKYDFEQIEKNKINPMTDITSSYDIQFRCSVVKSYIKYMPIIVNIILNYNILNYIPHDLKKILDKNNILNMDKKIFINSFNKNFNKDYEIYLSTLKPEIVYNYLLSMLSKYIIDFYDELNKNKVKISREIILYIINHIIQTEKKFSKIDINKYKTTFAKIDDNIENDCIKDPGESDDDNEEYENNNDEVTGDVDNDIFSREDIDITSEGNDGDDEDDVIADF